MKSLKAYQLTENNSVNEASEDSIITFKTDLDHSGKETLKSYSFYYDSSSPKFTMVLPYKTLGKEFDHKMDKLVNDIIKLGKEYQAKGV